MTTNEFINEYGEKAYSIACLDYEDPTEDYDYISRQIDDFIEKAGDDAYWEVYAHSGYSDLLNNLDEYLDELAYDPEQSKYQEREYWASV